jgi:hypothetical protein
MRPDASVHLEALPEAKEAVKNYTVTIEKRDGDWAVVIRRGRELLGIPYRARASKAARARCEAMRGPIIYAFEYGATEYRATARSTRVWVAR